ncbi:uncharacterized protein LOC131303853 isoform X2 [Rhododendron vialii]|uniref:uncharacterized protein LOC131303853 isoform X2 n=1 Tax=Rhododendron vialii TaxID=182163 RepID=UPI002660461B|nr:uncharacterized protein LOC131303853 isoform X2 [Rhododendron vialii]
MIKTIRSPSVMTSDNKVDPNVWSNSRAKRMTNKQVKDQSHGQWLFQSFSSSFCWSLFSLGFGEGNSSLVWIVGNGEKLYARGSPIFSSKVVRFVESSNLASGGLLVALAEESSVCSLGLICSIHSCRFFLN